ncbi:putative tight junction-associated protein 1 [Triplophysa rosa]|uniref:Tight junction-associated protein 1 n=1 Tax=Triplophysa rosa TaxID=992332 RepID=A0A9W7WNG4_TRIRA|nr:putative tight junction-associated protein 1 [Triplophysa rosa]
MTSAAPARKPYRKAPPQHRETRHTVPSFREEVSESVLPSASPETSAQPDPFQESLSDADRIKDTGILGLLDFNTNQQVLHDQ